MSRTVHPALRSSATRSRRAWSAPERSRLRRPYPTQALGDYLETYVERDVRRIGQIRDLSSFRRFVRLCAGRVGQLADLGSLGADAGIPQATARHRLTVLEASYVVFRLPPFFTNIRKQLVKSPKLYFYDVGLTSYLIGIEGAGQLAAHRLRGRGDGNERATRASRAGRIQASMTQAKDARRPPVGD